MKIYLMRHGHAGSSDPKQYPDDSQRPLTRAGQKYVAKSVRLIKKMNIPIDLILSSPFVRCHETAEIARKNLHLKKDQLVLTDLLAPFSDTSQLIADIKSGHAVENLLLVGHEPGLSGLISRLLSGDESLLITMKKSGICCLSIDELADGRCASQEWLINPALLDVF